MEKVLLKRDCNLLRDDKIKLNFARRQKKKRKKKYLKMRIPIH